MGNVQGPGNFFITLLIRLLWLAQGKFRKFFKSFSKRKDACPSFNFLPGFQFRFRDAGAGAAAGSAPALKVPLCEVIQHSVAAPVGEDNLARAVPVGAVTDLHDVEATVLQVTPNSEGMGDTSGLHICATDLQVTTNSEGMGALLACIFARVICRLRRFQRVWETLLACIFARLICRLRRIQRVWGTFLACIFARTICMLRRIQRVVGTLLLGILTALLLVILGRR